MPVDPFQFLRGIEQQYGLSDLDRLRRFPALGRQQELAQSAPFLGKVLGGVAYVGGILDKILGARAIRGLITGRPRELASIIPGSDVFGITNPIERATGEDVLSSLGIPVPESGLGRFAAGLGTEMLLDPATYLTLGALSGAGKAARAAGFVTKGQKAAPDLAQILTAKGIPTEVGQYVGPRVQRAALTPADVLKLRPELQAPLETAATRYGGLQRLMERPLGGLFGFGPLAPFGAPSVTFGTGPMAQRVARGMDVLGEAVRYSAPGLMASRLFMPSVLGGRTRIEQELGAGITQALKKPEQLVRREYAEMTQELLKGGRKPEEIISESDVLRQLTEGIGSAEAARPEYRSVAAKIAQGGNRVLLLADQVGIDRKPLVDKIIKTYVTRFGPRGGWRSKEIVRGTFRTARERAQGITFASRAMPVADPGMMAREDIVRNIVGGTTRLQQLPTEVGQQLYPLSAGIHGPAITEEMSNQKILSDFLGVTPEIQARKPVLEAQIKASKEMDAMAALGDLPEVTGLELPEGFDRAVAESELAAITGAEDQARQLTRMLGDIDEEFISGQQRLFPNFVLDDYVAGQRLAISTVITVDKLQDFLADSAQVLATKPIGREAYVPIQEALEKIGATKTTIVQGQGSIGAIPQILRKLADRGKIVASDAEALKNVYVPEELVNSATRMADFYTNPQAASGFMKIYDSLTNLFRAWNTAPWPGYNTRNSVSAVFTNLMLGTYRIKPYQQMHELLNGQTVRGASQYPRFRNMKISDEEATAILQREALEFSVTEGHGAPTLAGEITGEGLVEPVAKLMRRMPGVYPETLTRAVSPLLTGRREAWNPLNVAGFGGRTEDVFAPVAAGRRVASYSDNLMRGAAWLDAMTKGWDSAPAAARANAAHIDYSRLTRFERDVMRRVIPFYSFASRWVPMTLTELMTRPGGLVGQSIRVSTRTGEMEGGAALPPYVTRSGLALPLPGAEEGKQRFLTGFDLPYESVLAPLRFGATPTQTLRELGSGLMTQVHPLARLAGEAITGREFYGGRQLQQMPGRVIESTLGRFAGGPAGEIPPELQSLARWPVLEAVLRNLPSARLTSSLGRWIQPTPGAPLDIMNFLTGLRVSDIDPELVRRVQLRDVLTQQLTGQPGVREFSRLYQAPNYPVSPETLRRMQLLRTVEEQMRREARLR